MNPLASQRQLLVAESEINRAQLQAEWQAMTAGVRGLADRAKTLGAWASAATLLVAGVTALARGPLAPGRAKSSWFQTLKKALRVASTIWLAFRARNEKADPE